MWVVGELSAPVAQCSCWIELADHVQEHAHLHAFTSWTVTCPIHEFCKWTLMIVPTCGTRGFILVLILVQVSFLLWSVQSWSWNPEQGQWRNVDRADTERHVQKSWGQEGYVCSYAASPNSQQPAASV